MTSLATTAGKSAGISNFARFALLAAWTVLCLAGWVQPASAQAGVEFKDVAVDYQFGEELVFQARISPFGDVSEVYLFIQPAGEQTRLVKIDAFEQGDILYRYDLRQHALRSFSEVVCWFRAVTKDGAKFESSRQSLYYIDNRMPWQTLEAGSVQVNWLAGDLFYGQAALNVARTGLKAAANILPNFDLPRLQIFIYQSASRLQEAVVYGSNIQVVGHASPDLGVVLVSIPPGFDQQFEMERQIPHEIMHLMIYQAVQDQYNNVPTWLNEGLASQVEGIPNSDYPRAIQKAVKENKLLSIASLCPSFPSDASGAFLAYAQSASFVRFLQNKVGNRGLADLLGRYKNGLNCSEGVLATSNLSLDQLDYRWRQETLGMDTGWLAVQNLSPYLLVGGLIIGAPLAAAGWSRRRGRAETKGIR